MDTVNESLCETTVTSLTQRLFYVVVMLAQPILSMQFCSDHFLHCSSVFSLSCSNFCWSFLPHWQISGKSLFGYCFYRFFYYYFQIYVKCSLKWIICCSSCKNATDVSWKVEEKILGHFFSWCNSHLFTELFYLLTICPSVCYHSDVQIRIFYICHPYQVLLRASVCQQSIWVYIFTGAFSLQKSWSRVCDME